MRLTNLFAGVEAVALAGPADAEIRSVSYDSRKVLPGALFFVLRGEKLNGLDYLPQALERGAVAVASESPRPAAIDPEISWIQLVRGSERRGLARVAANFYGHPADTLKLVGVTGTNGKTTTTFLVDAIVRAAGFVDGLVGTTGYRTPSGERPAVNTTPESLDLQQMFAEIRDAGGTHAVIEASSHALAMERLTGCHFAAAVFTNLTRDHLDYHRTFEDYFAAKKLLFEGTGAEAPDTAVINVDDSYGVRLKGLAKQTLTYSLKGAADLTAKKFELSPHGLEFTAQTPAGPINVRSALVGRINVYNILGALGAAIALNIPVKKIEAGIEGLQAVPGRFQRVDEGQPFLVVVDYAHTDDALRNLIATAREIRDAASVAGSGAGSVAGSGAGSVAGSGAGSVAGSGGARVITVFGAGGERDRTKRPLMGEAAGSLSDLVVLTSDNPRGEDPLNIINDVVVGLQKANANYRTEPDRGKAIAMALDEARDGDIVLLAGKGHETYQILKEGSVDFDDREVARANLRRKGFSKAKRRS